MSDDQVQAFGQWDAPITDGARWIDVPTHRECMYCQRPFEPGDNGAIMSNGWAQHRECSLRSVLGGIGHLIDHARYCIALGDPDAGLDFRASALLVWKAHVEGAFITTSILDLIAGRPPDPPAQLELAPEDPDDG